MVQFVSNRQIYEQVIRDLRYDTILKKEDCDVKQREDSIVGGNWPQQHR